LRIKKPITGGDEMLLNEYRPKPSLVTKTTQVLRPRFPLIDAHNHLEGGFGNWLKRPVGELLAVLDDLNIRGYVDLDGAWSEDILYRHLEHFKGAAPERFRVFGGVDWSKWPELGDDFVDYAVERLHEQARRGADGLKVWKDLGLHVTDGHGLRVPVDDPRLDPLWAAAGALGLPVTLHLADPVAFFDPLDETNERWEELQANPDWHFPNPPFPPFLTIMEGMANVIARHPQTTFIGAHAGCYGENLGWVGALFERCPNFYIDISARLGELGRQPYSARRFFIQYADRILFGLDASPTPANYQPYFRFLETDDEYFPYSPGEIPSQGRWMIYGINLPDDVLEKIYFRNAEKILF
jgi:predicted TIM-barrel fold metal-dependent hydrolase